MSDRPFEILGRECRTRGLHLELHVGSKLHGEKGKEWRDLDRLDVMSGDGRQVLASADIGSDVETAARVVLHRLSEAT